MAKNAVVCVIDDSLLRPMDGEELLTRMCAAVGVAQLNIEAKANRMATCLHQQHDREVFGRR